MIIFLGFITIIDEVSSISITGITWTKRTIN